MPYLNRRIAPLEEAGAASYALYLIHYPLISLLVKVAVKIDQSVAIPHAVYFVAILVICQLAAFAFHRLIEAPLLNARSMQNLFAPTRTATAASNYQGRAPAPSSD